MSFPTSELPAIVITGTMKDKKTDFGNSFDPDYITTEGQYRALYMKLSRIMNDNDFQYNQKYAVDSTQMVYFAANQAIDNPVFYAVVASSEILSDGFAENLFTVANRGGIYSAKKFYEELQSLDKSERHVVGEEISSEQAKSIITSLVIAPENVNYVNLVLSSLAKADVYGGDNVFTDVIRLLGEIPMGIDADIILDSCFQIARKYDKLNLLDRSFQIYQMIADMAMQFERLPLMITSQMRCAVIARKRQENPEIILDLLSNIDDGSLEVAQQEERELFYTLQGYCFDVMGQKELAEELHYMAIMIAESESSPSIHVAESHAFLGSVASSRYEPEIATRQYITASTISLSNNDLDMSKLYSHKAALQEIRWATYLASTAIVMNSNADLSNIEFYAWQSMKRLVNAVTHSDRDRRTLDILEPSAEVLRMIKQVFPKSSEYGMATINELEQHLGFIGENALPPDQEKELFKFISSKISAMLPLPPPVILLIANDGRLIIGGEIGKEQWDQSILTNDILFSGALSAIMAIISEVISGDDPLRMLDAGQTQIMIERTDVCIGALLVDRDLNILRKALIEVLNMVELSYPGLANWDGYSIDFSDLQPRIEAIFQKAMENLSS
ncbi:MAG: hypothetical protein ACXAE3_08360 [Candidatus Kariarchaeaceae archaeon]